MNNEIHLNEEFGYYIYQTIIQYDLRNNLEIGSWDGEGSTKCFVEAMKQLTGNKSLYCIEIVKDKIERLKQLYANTEFVFPIFNSSISYKNLLDNDFSLVWNSQYNKIPKHVYNEDMVKSWFDRDVETLKGIEHGFLETTDIQNWDSVLIDGGEFTGYSEFVLLKDKTKVFFLDDVHSAFKCNKAYETLKADTNWSLMKENSQIRNGYAIFIKK